MEVPAATSSVRVLVRPPSSSSSTPLATRNTPAAPPAASSDLLSSSPFLPPPAVSSCAPAQPPPEGVVVVGFVGCGEEEDVSHLINRILDATVFGSGGLDKDLFAEGREDVDGKADWFQHRKISYHYEEEKGIVFLQFSSFGGSVLSASRCTGSVLRKGALEAFMEVHDSEDLRGLLLMFSVCHVIIFLHQGTRFDTHLLQKFRILQVAKHDLAPCIRSHIIPTAAQKLSSFPTKPSVHVKSSHSLGRAGSSRHGSSITLMSGSSSHPSALPGQCTPVILFAFLDDYLDYRNGMDDYSDLSSTNNHSSHITPASRSGLTSKGSSVVMLSRSINKTEGSLRKKLHSSLESQIRFLIKKCRILSSMESSHSGSRGAGSIHHLPLFSLDASRVVVLLDKSANSGIESLNFVTKLIEEALTSKVTFDLLGHDVQSSSNEDIQSVKEFIFRQSDILRGKGSMSSCPSASSVMGVGMVAAAAAAAAASAASGKALNAPELPSLECWLSESNHFLKTLVSAKHMMVDVAENIRRVTPKKFVMVAQDEGISATGKNDAEYAVSYLENSRGLNMKFSILWCKRALPVAKEIYLKDLPTCYPTALHGAQLEKALTAFHHMVKGPAVQIFAKRLEDECISIWEAGRQLCDAISLAGKPCIHQRHHAEATGPQSEKNSKKHSSGFVFLHACSCGRSRHLRDDPFDFDTANAMFSCFPSCHGILPRLVIPETNSRGPLSTSSWSLVRLGGSGYYDPSNGLLQSGFCSDENLLLKWTILLQMHKAIKTDDMHSIPLISSPKNTKVLHDTGEKIGEIDNTIETLGNDQKNDINDISMGSTISFGKGLPSFVMKKAFSEVVAGTTAVDSKLSLLHQKKQPTVPVEKDLNHKDSNDITNNQTHAPGRVQEFRKTDSVSLQQGLQTSLQMTADPFLQIGSNVVPVNIDCDKKTKLRCFTKEVNVYIGFEHECPHGHRFLLSTKHLKEPTSYSLLESPIFPAADDCSGSVTEKFAKLNTTKEGFSKSFLPLSCGTSPVNNMRKKTRLAEVRATSFQHYFEIGDNQQVCEENFKEILFPVRIDDVGSAFSLLNRNLPLFMTCPHCINSMEKDQEKLKFATKISQLQRIFVVTPPFPFLLATCPIIQFELSCLPESIPDRERQSQFSPGCPIVLPPESFLAFRLPFIYGVQLDDGSLEPLHHFELQPELTAWLVKGTALQLMPKDFNFIYGLETA